MDIIKEQTEFLNICMQSTIERSRLPPSTIIKKISLRLYTEIQHTLDKLCSFGIHESKNINKYLSKISFVPSIDHSEPAVICAIHCLIQIINKTGHGTILSLENFINYANRSGNIYEMKSDPSIGCWFILVASYSHSMKRVISKSFPTTARSMLAHIASRTTSSVSQHISSQRISRLVNLLSPDNISQFTFHSISPSALFASLYGPLEASSLFLSPPSDLSHPSNPSDPSDPADPADPDDPMDAANEADAEEDSGDSEEEEEEEEEEDEEEEEEEDEEEEGGDGEEEEEEEEGGDGEEEEEEEEGGDGEEEGGGGYGGEEEI